MSSYDCETRNSVRAVAQEDLPAAAAGGESSDEEVPCLASSKPFNSPAFVQIEMEDVDDGEAEPEENVPLTETHSKRLAIMNLQWDRIKVRRAHAPLDTVNSHC